MKLLLTTLIFALLCLPTNVLSNKNGTNNLFWEFSQLDNHYTFRGSFYTEAELGDLLHILFDFEHLTNFVTSPHSIILLRREKNWYEVCYTYRKLLLENKFTYRKTLIEGEHKITFELITSEQPDPIFPKVLSSKGYYEIKPEGKGWKVNYFEEVRLGSKLPSEISSQVVKRENVKFLEELKKYVERKCN